MLVFRLALIYLGTYVLVKHCYSLQRTQTRLFGLLDFLNLKTMIMVTVIYQSPNLARKFRRYMFFYGEKY